MERVMARSFLGKLALILCVTCCLVPVGANLTFTDDSFTSYEVPEGEKVVIDCSTTSPAYDTAVIFKHIPVPEFFLAPDGKRIVQEEQFFIINNVTQRDSGEYICFVRDRDFGIEVKKAAAIFVVPDLQMSNAEPVPLDLKKSKPEESAAMKLRASKPYLYFKQKSPLRFNVKQDQPFELSLSVKGLQPIKLQWKKDDHELMIGSRYKTFDSGRRLSVDPPFAMEDAGTYSVSACNSKGCAVKGVQVLFYEVANISQIIQGEETDDTQDGGFIEKFLKKYGFLGIPAGLAIILIIAISCTAGGTKKAKKEPKIEVIEKVHIHRQRGEGRTASLWSWQSDGDSSGDDMPDYYKYKGKSQRKQRKQSQINISHESPTQPGYDHSDYATLRQSYGESHYGSVYSNVESIYDDIESYSNNQSSVRDHRPIESYGSDQTNTSYHLRRESYDNDQNSTRDHLRRESYGNNQSSARDHRPIESYGSDQTNTSYHLRRESYDNDQNSTRDHLRRESYGNNQSSARDHRPIESYGSDQKSTRDHLRRESYGKGQANYKATDNTQYSGSQSDYAGNEKKRGQTQGSRYSQHSSSQLNKGLYKPESVASIVEEDLDEVIYASVDVQSGIQPTRAQVLETKPTTTQPSPAAQAHTRTVNIDDEDDFMFYPDFFEFD